MKPPTSLIERTVAGALRRFSPVFALHRRLTFPSADTDKIDRSKRRRSKPSTSRSRLSVLSGRSPRSNTSRPAVVT